MNYTDIIRDLLDQQYPDPEETTSIVITNIVLRILPLPARPYFTRYQHLETLVISKCDLRNLQNFPKLLSLKQLDLSDNSIQGTLNHLMPLARLNYLNLANNLINDFRKLQPLQVIQGLEIYVVGNPFVDGETWKNKVRNYGLKVLKEPRVLQIQCKKVKQEDKRQEKKETKQPELSLQPTKKQQNHPPPHNSTFLEMRSRRQRKIIEQQQRAQTERRNLIQMQSDSMSLFGVLGQNELDNMLDQEDEQSEQLNDSDNEESDKDKQEDENEVEEAYLNHDFVPLLDVFDADEDIELDQDPSESPSDD